MHVNIFEQKVCGEIWKEFRNIDSISDLVLNLSLMCYVIMGICTIALYRIRFSHNCCFGWDFIRLSPSRSIMVDTQGFFVT